MKTYDYDEAVRLAELGIKSRTVNLDTEITMHKDRWNIVTCFMGERQIYKSDEIKNAEWTDYDD